MVWKPLLSYSHNCMEQQVKSKTFLPSYQVTTIRTLEGFGRLSDTWDSFINLCGVSNLCLTYGWIATWFRHFEEAEPFILLAHDESGNWVGVAPLQIKQNRTGLAHRLLRAVEWIGTKPTVFDWLQFVIHPHANEPELFRAFAGAIAKEKWHVLELQFCANKKQLEQLIQALPVDWTSQIQSAEPIPYLALPNSNEIYEKTRRKKTRLEVNRHKNRMIRDFGSPPHLSFKTHRATARQQLTRFFNSHIRYWAERGQKSNFIRYPKLCGFYQSLLPASSSDGFTEPHLQFSVLTVNGIEMSYHLGFWQGNGYLAHLCSFNPEYKDYSPGTIHMDSLVYATLAKKGTTFEMGNGDEPYKTMWAREKKELWQLYIARNAMSAFLWTFDQKLIHYKNQL